MDQTKDYTRELIAKAHNNDKEAREKLVTDNLGLIWNIIKRFKGRGIEQEDLFQIGCIGLIKAIDNFNLDMDVAFSTYAVPMITGEIRRCKVLEINGVGYRGAKQGKKLVLNLGYSHPVEIADPEGIETVMEGQNKIIIKGIDKEKVGQFAAEIRTKREPEPYKGKGIKYADETIRRKVGKTGKK